MKTPVLAQSAGTMRDTAPIISSDDALSDGEELTVACEAADAEAAFYTETMQGIHDARPRETLSGEDSHTGYVPDDLGAPLRCRVALILTERSSMLRMFKWSLMSLRPTYGL
ncbi:hypothetical protein ABID21_004295 [Pseudorhizobium tarimense]|uniref:Ig-like domain-containing protein n=1 Tax=Pseudorhizobium tarimense TaxID=1079109 RepID=A0ABV2HC94_9HYPH